MPLPKPKTNESKSDFLDRCMGDSVANKEFPDEKQRFAMCNSQWEEESKKSARSAIRIHHTSTSKGSWDADSNEKRLKDDGSGLYYRMAYALQDPEANEETKSTYKFIHHEVDGSGKVGAANLKACHAGIGILNGARGDPNIPSIDKDGIWHHLAAHIKDAGEESAPLGVESKLDSMDGMERRVFSVEDLRIVRSNDKPEKMPTIEGYAAVFNKLSENLGGFVEKIAPGAFTKALRTSDTRALFNHDVNYVLGRESSKTLILKEDNKGLHMKVYPPDTQLIRDMVIAPIERGDIKEQSFGFMIASDEWDKVDSTKNKVPTRTITAISRLFDVSPVTFPAYPDTQVAVRSLDLWKETEKEREHRASPNGNDLSHVDAEPKQSAPLSERIAFEREYLDKSKKRRRENVNDN